MGGASPGYRNLLNGAGASELCEPPRPDPGHRPPETSVLDAWFELNYRLQEEATHTQVNKAFLDQWLTRLWTIASPSPRCFWLFLARINELVLLCASRYVDCCDFAAADELLAVPNRCFSPVEMGALLKEKGYAGCEERGGGIGPGRSLVLTKRRPGSLLASLYDLLAESGCMTEEYLLSVLRRTEKVMQVSEMLVELEMYSTEDFSLKLSCMDVPQRRKFRSRLCLFDQKTFNELGRALHLFMSTWNVHDEYVRKYLRGSRP